MKDFCESPVVKILCSQCRGHRFEPWSWFHMSRGEAKKKKKNFPDDSDMQLKMRTTVLGRSSVPDSVLLLLLLLSHFSRV